MEISRTTLRTLCLCWSCAIHSLCVLAQDVNREIFTSWDDFLSNYAMPLIDAESGAESSTSEWLQVLTELHEEPLNLNSATREELLQLPFLSEAQVDSLLSYRTRKGALLSLGELQLVSGMTYDARKYCSLFLYCGALTTPAPSFRERLINGKHELSYTLDLPLYRRAGFHPLKEDGSLKPESQVYLGYPQKHLVRHRYRSHHGVAYGLTMEQDSGEPFHQSGITNFDHTSGYFRYTSPTSSWDICLGDYRLQMGQGLLIGRSLYGGRTALINARPMPQPAFSPHTGTDESRFFRGIVGTYKRGMWHTLAFLSYRKLDARIANGVVTSFITNGYHRTATELQRKGNLGALMGGLSLTRRFSRQTISLNAYGLRYSHAIQPTLRDYNRYYHRGTTAMGFSTSYSLLATHWQAQCEAAIDAHGHPAITGWVHHLASPDLKLTLQARFLSNAYAAPYAQTAAVATRTQGEQGILLGFTHRNLWQWKWQGTFETYRRTIPTTQSDAGALGVVAHLQAERPVGRNTQILLRYNCRANQSREDEVAQQPWSAKHRLRLQSSWTYVPFSLAMYIEGILHWSQTQPSTTGGLVAMRASYTPFQRLRLSASMAYYHTADYATALYAYDPHFKGLSRFTPCYDHGIHSVALAEWQALKHWKAGVRYSCTYTPNRPTTGSGAELIEGTMRAELCFHVSHTF